MSNDLFGMDLDAGMGFLDKKENKKNDGILRFDLKKIKESKDPKSGISVLVRFLPNITKEGKMGAFAIEKSVHYVKLQNHPELNGYIDSSVDGKCPLKATYWELKNSKSVIDNEKAELINSSKKWYSYVQIIKHETEPELNGKIMIFPYGKKIFDKIELQKVKKEVNVFDWTRGKDFTIIAKEVGGYVNYDSSEFEEKSAIKIPSSNGDLKEVPTVELNGKIIIDPKFQDRVKEYLLSREIDLDSFAPKSWDVETSTKVDKIISILKNNPIVSANNSIASANSKSDATFFEEDEDVVENTTIPSSKKDDDFFDDF